MDPPIKEGTYVCLEDSSIEDAPSVDKTGVLAIVIDENDDRTMESCSLHVIKDEMDEISMLTWLRNGSHNTTRS